MPSLPSFDVVNQRPSTVMRTLTAAVGGGFYVDGLTVHAWAGSVTEPGPAEPGAAHRRALDAQIVSADDGCDAAPPARARRGPAHGTLIALSVDERLAQHRRDRDRRSRMPRSSISTLDPETLQLARFGAQWMRARGGRRRERCRRIRRRRAPPRRITAGATIDAAQDDGRRSRRRTAGFGSGISIPAMPITPAIR